MRKFDTLLRAALVLLFSYILALGGTYTGVTTPLFQTVSLGVLVLIFILWLLVHWRRRWIWFQTPLDLLLIVWAAAFGLSLLANLETWRRIVIGLWYVGLYLGVWYWLHDAIANRGIRQDMLVDALLFSGLVILFFGYWQVYSWVSTTDLNGTFALPRPVSLLGNPNFLSALLVILIPFIVGRLISVRSRLAQGVMVVYALLALLMLFLTFSRGAWLGLGVASIVWFGMLLARHDLLSLRKLRVWWRGQAQSVRAAVIGAGVLVLMASGAAAAIVIQSLTTAGRDVGFRTYLYEAALRLFAEKPLTGYGLFTFGRYLPRFASMPDVTPHTHAHDVPLQIAAELGVIGLVALVLTLVLLTKAIWQNFRQAQGRDQIIVISATAGVVGFGIHHLLDTPAMMPAIALVGLVALVLASAPTQAQPLTTRWRLIGHPLAMIGLFTLLIASGFWNLKIYSDYWNALSSVYETGDYRTAAGGMQAAVDADPGLSIYQAQQAFLLGMAYSEGDLHAGIEAVTAYQRLIAMEPYYAPYRANLGMLLWNTGQEREGLEMLQSAAALAPESWQIQYDVGLYAEALERLGPVAEAAYRQALIANPDADLYPTWGQTAMQSGIVSDASTHSPLAQAAILMESGDSESALTLWQAELSDRAFTSNLVLRGLIALAAGDREAASDWLARAEKGLVVDNETAWLHLGAARLARFDGDESLVKSELEAAHEALQQESLDADYQDGVNVANGQFLRQAIARQFLPQVHYPTADPVLMYLLEATGNPN
ncbi:MAG: O-antigen ligase family protein [Anaerolineae bacterium]|nr:O-antigen ligase family protein [Anaerolineae bacterium]